MSYYQSLKKISSEDVVNYINNILVGQEIVNPFDLKVNFDYNHVSIVLCDKLSNKSSMQVTISRPISSIDFSKSKSSVEIGIPTCGSFNPDEDKLNAMIYTVFGLAAYDNKFRHLVLSRMISFDDFIDELRNSNMKS